MNKELYFSELDELLENMDLLICPVPIKEIGQQISLTSHLKAYGASIDNGVAIDLESSHTAWKGTYEVVHVGNRVELRYIHPLTGKRLVGTSNLRQFVVIERIHIMRPTPLYAFALPQRST